MSGEPLPLCFFCKHFDKEAWSKDWKERNCAAFPSGIPDLIWEGRWDHREHLALDGGVRFEPKSDLNGFIRSVAYIESERHSLSRTLSSLSVGRVQGYVKPRPRKYPR
jgi:hypothetical protein